MRRSMFIVSALFILAAMGPVIGGCCAPRPSTSGANGGEHINGGGAGRHAGPGDVVRDSTGAIEEAQRFVGMFNSQEAATAVRTIRQTDDSPFIHSTIEGRPLWHVTFARVSISVPGGLLWFDRFEVLVDPSTGSIVKMWAGSTEGPGVPWAGSAQSAERQLRADGIEFWQGIPAAAPDVSFVAALRAVGEAGFDVFHCEALMAHYIEWSFMERPAMPVWSITTTGGPPLPASRPGLALEGLNHLRHIVDARTGKWLTATSSPQPDGPAKP